MTHRHTVSRKKIIQSKGLLLTLIILFMFAGTGAINYAANMGVYTLPYQILFYVCIFLIAWLVYRNHIVEYRYEASEQALFVFRVLGKREKPMEGVMLADIEAILPYPEAMEGPHGLEHNLSAVAKKKAQAVVYHNAKGRLHWLIISPSDAFLAILKEKTAAARQAKDAPAPDAPEDQH